MRTAILCLILFLPNHAGAQDSVPFRKAIKISCFSPIYGIISLHYERSLRDDRAINVFYFFGMKSAQGVERGGTYGYGLGGEFRFYKYSSSTSRGYVGPFVRYKDIDFRVFRNHAPFLINTIGGGMILGWQWIGKNTLTEVNFGPEINSTNFRARYVFGETFPVPMLRFGVNLGLKR